MSKQESLQKLTALLKELCEARFEGASASRIARAQGLADGYMRALVDFGIADDAELLTLASEEGRLASKKAQARQSAFKGAPFPYPNWA